MPDYRLLNLRYGTRFEPQDVNEIRQGTFRPGRPDPSRRWAGEHLLNPPERQ